VLYVPVVRISRDGVLAYRATGAYIQASILPNDVPWLDAAVQYPLHSILPSEKMFHFVRRDEEQMTCPKMHLEFLERRRDGWTDWAGDFDSYSGNCSSSWC
jgi:hypothetical protein